MGLRMTWGDGHKWTTSVSLPAGTALEFKVGSPDPDDNMNMGREGCSQAWKV